MENKYMIVGKITVSTYTYVTAKTEAEARHKAELRSWDIEKSSENSNELANELFLVDEFDGCVDITEIIEQK